MGNVMAMPNDWREFMQDFSFKDSKEVYTNGSQLIQVFRVEQMLEHYFVEKNGGADNV